MVEHDYLDKYGIVWYACHAIIMLQVSSHNLSLVSTRKGSLRSDSGSLGRIVGIGRKVGLNVDVSACRAFKRLV